MNRKNVSESVCVCVLGDIIYNNGFRKANNWGLGLGLAVYELPS